MDDQIAPQDSVDPNPIEAYRRYLMANTGDRALGAGPDVPQASAAPPQGAEIAPVAPQMPQAGPAGPQAAPPAAPQIAPVAPSGGGVFQPNSLIDPDIGQNDAPQAPQAPEAPRAKKAPRAKGAAQAPQAGQAPTVGGITSDESQMTPASGHIVKGAKNDQGKPLVATAPSDHDPSTAWNQDKLKDVQDGHDMLDAMKPGARTKYMDWWEQQHGDINKRYDQMRAELGQRPDPNREPTRQEKFGELLNFGLSLLQNAKRGNDPMAAMGASAQEALGAQKAKQQQQTADFDQRTAGVEAQRQNQLKDIGNYGNAVREDAMIQDANARTARALRPPRAAAPTTRVLKDGTQVQYNPESNQWEPSVGSDGKPINPNLAAGGRGSGVGHVSSMVQQVQQAIADGMSKEQAYATVYHTKPTDSPIKTATSIYQAERRNGASEQEAHQIATEQTDAFHGSGALARAQQANNKPKFAPTPPDTPPPPGKIGHTPDGYRWRNENGKAVLVQ
jgi:hypothetical protein